MCSCCPRYLVALAGGGVFFFLNTACPSEKNETHSAIKHIQSYNHIHRLHPHTATHNHTHTNMSLSSLRLLESYVEDLSLLVDESSRLKALQLSYEHNDHELRKSLAKITKFLERNDDGENYEELVDEYEELRSKITTLDTAMYKYTRNIVKKVDKKKSVRFNETLQFQDSPQESIKASLPAYRDTVVDSPDAALSDELFQGRTREAEDDDETESINSASNTEVFIQHQQQLLDQDVHLDALAESVRRQHGLSVGIHSELHDQNILLDDLEAQLDSSDRRLHQGRRRLEYFTQKAKENGQWLTIIVLVLILVLLLIVLK